MIVHNLATPHTARKAAEGQGRDSAIELSRLERMSFDCGGSYTAEIGSQKRARMDSEAQVRSKR